LRRVVVQGGPSTADVEDAMRTWPRSLLAVVPLLPLDLVPPVPPPCAVAIELQVRAPAPWGRIDWRVMTAETERLWAPYGITVCWDSGPSGACRGLEIRLRVLVAADATPPHQIGADEPRTGVPERAGAAGRASPPGAVATDAVLGWIAFRGREPGPDIVLSIAGARSLVRHATVGSRPLAEWPAAAGDALVPRVLGRVLGHEMGHYLMRSRAHTRTGLMAGAFRPDQAALDPSSRFRLSGSDAAAIRARCQAPAPPGLVARGVANAP
jgi:hypothetical protein